jgi:hypothetical protein
MRARYLWTTQLDHILCLIGGLSDSDITPVNRLSMLETLGGLEMDEWIIGR